METRLSLPILPQPDDTTCGPTCLHAVYRFYGETVPLERIIAEVPVLAGGGTLAVWLACHALRRGFRARIYTYKLQLFDPTWLTEPQSDLAAKLQAQMACKDDPKLRTASQAFLDYLALGGEVRFADLTPALVRRYLKRGIPILTGLSATYLYRSPREYGPRGDYDDVRGEPAGHFVILTGYNRQTRRVQVADPLRPNPLGAGQYYEIDIERVLGAILLGVLTYDANLLLLQPAAEKSPDAQPDRR